MIYARANKSPILLLYKYRRQRRSVHFALVCGNTKRDYQAKLIYGRTLKVSPYTIIKHLSLIFLYMSRKITNESVRAFLCWEDFRKSNMEVSQSIQGTHMYLHGNEIARIERDFENEKDTISITDAWWNTNTTKERLNGIPWVSIVQRNFKWYLNGNEWDWSWTTI